MGNLCFKGYSPKKTPKDKYEDKTKNGEEATEVIETPRNNHKDGSQRQISQGSLCSTGTLSDEEVSMFFSSPEEIYELRQSRRSRDKKSNAAKSRDDFNANDVRLDLSGITNPAFTSDNELVLSVKLQTPPNADSTNSAESTPCHRPELVRIPDSFKLSKYVISQGLESDNSNDRLGSQIEESSDFISNAEIEIGDQRQVLRAMSSEEVVDLIDKLLLTNPGQSSTDANDSKRFRNDSVDSSFTTSQEDTDSYKEQIAEMDRQNSAARGRLTRMPHVDELSEEMDITLRNQVLLETGHKVESLERDNTGLPKSNKNLNGKGVHNEALSGSKGLPQGPSVSSSSSIGVDEDQLWTGIEMTEQNLLSRIAAIEVTNDEEIVDVLDNISRNRQRMLNVRWAVPYEEGHDLPTELSQEKLVQKLEAEKNYSRKLDNLNREIASNLINAQKIKDMTSLQAIIEDHKRRQSALHAQLVTQKERVDRHLAGKLKQGSSKADEFDEDSEESNIECILGLSIEDIRRNPDKEDSIETESPLDYDGRFSRIDDHNGANYHDSDADDHETDDLIMTAYEELLDQSSDEEVLVLKGRDGEEEVGPDDETLPVLRSTLKEDVKLHLNQMTATDFQDLLGVYRQEELRYQGIKQDEKTDRHSLWDKIEHRRKVSEEVGVGSSVPSKTDAATEVGRSMLMNEQNDVAVQATEVNNVNKDVQTIQKKFLLEMESLDSDLVNKLSKRQEAMTQAELETILKTHIDTLEDLRKRRKRESDKIQKKLEEKLSSRMRNSSVESLEDGSVDDVSKRNSLVGSNAETEYKVHRREMEKADLFMKDNEIKLRKEINEKAGDLSVDDVRELLKDYRKQQKDLLQKRDIRRKLMNDKLVSVLEERKLQKLSLQESSQSEGTGKDHKPTGTTSNVVLRRKTALDTDVEEMDAEFYKDLMNRYGKSSMSEEQLEKLLEEHLDKVEAFQKKVKGALSKKRKERSAAEKEQRRLRKLAKKQAEEDNAKHANELVQKQQEQTNQMRQLRERERKRASLLLREKLAKKQYMHGEPLSDRKIDS